MLRQISSAHWKSQTPNTHSPLAWQPLPGLELVPVERALRAQERDRAES